MNEEQNYERFDVDNDYEGGQFIGDEFFYNQKRQKRAQTEEDRIYGVFAGSSDEEEQGRKRRRKQKDDFTKPVAFVSKGVTQPDKSVKEENKPDEDLMNARAGLGSSAGAGLGFGGAGLGSTGGGLGFQPSASGQDEDAKEDVGFAIQDAKLRQRAEARRQNEERKAKVERRKASGAHSDIGTFEQYTKGIGSKLLEKMGYVQGGGLGREGQGIARPIDSKLRPKAMGLGFGDYKEHKLAMPGEEKEEDKDVAKAAVKTQSNMWRRNKKAARQGRVFKTVEELVNEAAESKPMVTQTIIDMRGPQARVVTNLEHLNVKDETAVGDSVPMPELQHNLQLLVDLAEADIQQLDAKLRHEKDTAVILGREQQRLAGEMEAHRDTVERADQLVDSILRCQASNDSMALEEIQDVHTSLKATYREEYILYNLAAVGLSQALPRFTALMHNWSPLTQPQHGVETFVKWRWLLQEEGRSGVLQTVDRSSDPYVKLVCETVLPAVRRDITNVWDPKDPGPLERFIEVWSDAMPEAVLQYMLDTLVMPRLRMAVDAWDPLSDTVALHVWLHPWLPYLAEPMTQLYPAIRFKFVNALQAWHPSDGSAYAILSPWAQVFEAKEWESLLSRSILPKLAFALQQLVVNPGNQDLTAMNWVLRWSEVVPVRMLVQLLETHFFPQWHAVLHHWLSNSPNYDEVTAWYLGWKGVFPQNMLDHERMRNQLNAALNAMHSAADGKAVPQYKQSDYGMPTYGAVYGAAAPAAAPPPMPAPAQPSTWSSDAHLSLRALVEHTAMEHNVVLMPKAGRMHDNLQVYGFGGVSIVMDTLNNVIKAQVGGVWRPVALSDLLQLSGQGSR